MVAWRHLRFTGMVHPRATVSPSNPILAVRTYLALSEPDLPKGPDGKPGYRIWSGARSYAEQKQMYLDWRAGRRKVPVVANPDSRRSDGRVGSNHMTQPGGIPAIHLADGDVYHREHLSHAFDIVPYGIPNSPANWRALERACNRWGLYQRVGVTAWNHTGAAVRTSGHYEPWHYEVWAAWRPGHPLTELAYVGRRLEMIPTVSDGIDPNDPEKYIQLRENFRRVMKRPDMLNRPWSKTDRELLVAAEIWFK